MFMMKIILIWNDFQNLTFWLSNYSHWGNRLDIADICSFVIKIFTTIKQKIGVNVEFIYSVLKIQKQKFLFIVLISFS